MHRALWISFAAVGAFALMVIWRLPASWVLPPPSGPVACAAVAGTIWDGVCTGMRLRGTILGDLAWTVQPDRLLAAQLAAHVTLANAGANGSADLEVNLARRVTARQVLADLTLDPAVMPAAPANLRGHAHVELALLVLEQGALTRLVGSVEARDLEERTVNRTRLGGYRLDFPAGASGDPLGQLRDLGDGPLAVSGTVRLLRPAGYEVEGLVALRPGAPAELSDTVQFLGSPDAQGRRSFSLQGRF